MSSRLLNRFIIEQLDPPLAELGFQRRVGTWNRTSGQFTQVIEAQLASYAEPGNESFTINLGIFWARTYEIWPEKPVPKFVSAVDCIFTLRIGAVAENLPDKPADLWWTLREPNELEPLGREIEDLLFSKALPFLEGFTSVGDVRDFLETRASLHIVAPTLRPLYLALLKAELGDLKGAQSALEAGRVLGSPEWTKRATIVAKAIGLEGDS